MGRRPFERSRRNNQCFSHPSGVECQSSTGPAETEGALASWRARRQAHLQHDLQAWSPSRCLSVPAGTFPWWWRLPGSIFPCHQLNIEKKNIIIVPICNWVWWTCWLKSPKTTPWHAWRPVLSSGYTIISSTAAARISIEIRQFRMAL